MPLLIALSVACQLACAVHVFKTGRPQWWFWVILAGSFLGVAVYVLVEVLPDLRRSPGARRLVRRAGRVIDPEREKRLLMQRLALADTVETRRQLADELLDLGDAAGAERVYRACLEGIYANEPHLMLSLARAQFAQVQYAAVRDTLEALMRANPGFRSHQGHLIYARSLEGLGETDKALSEYRALAPGYVGEEGRARLALLLEHRGHREEAQQVWQEIRTRGRVAPRYYRRDQREWLQLAELRLREHGA